MRCTVIQRGVGMLTTRHHADSEVALEQVSNGVLVEMHER